MLSTENRVKAVNDGLFMKVAAITDEGQNNRQSVIAATFTDVQVISSQEEQIEKQSSEQHEIPDITSQGNIYKRSKVLSIEPTRMQTMTPQNIPSFVKSQEKAMFPAIVPEDEPIYE